MAALRARVGRGDEALRFLSAYREHTTSRNGFHLNGVITGSKISNYRGRAFTLAGNFAAAAARVDRSRADTTTARGPRLPSLVANGVTNATTLVPGGASCVPRIPVNNATSACGNLWEALKYEYRMETQLTNYGAWFIAGRGWGDLPGGTPQQWPVPYQEMDTRAQAFYQMLGPAAVGTYGI